MPEVTILREGVTTWNSRRFASLQFHWLEKYALLVEPESLGKARSRDPKDDMFVACALAAGARFIVSGDQDLLVLGKPFGIEIGPACPIPLAS